MEFYYKNVPLLYYANYFNKNIILLEISIQKHFPLPLFSFKVTLYFQVYGSRGFILTKDNCNTV
jgi:hypothetical protein